MCFEGGVAAAISWWLRRRKYPHRTVETFAVIGVLQKQKKVIDDPSRIMYPQFTHLCKCISFKV
jgi:hypothetical protein